MGRNAVITGPQRKFCELFAVDNNATAAYRAAYPNAAPDSARNAAARLLAKDCIKEEIQRIRAAGQKKAGSAVLTLARIHKFLYDLVEARPALLAEDSELWQSIKRTKDGVEYRLPDKLGAIARWCDIQGEGSEAGANDSLAQLLGRIRK